MNLPDPDLVAKGLIITVGAGGLARLVGAVSPSGLWAGLAVGVCISVGLGAPGLVAPCAFVLLGVAATRWRYDDKKARGIAEPTGGARGGGRVMAKGFIGTALALVALSPDAHPLLVRLAFSGAFAAAAADTLGTEVGQVLGKTAFTVLPPRRVEPGTEGALSVQGTLAALAAAVVVAVSTAWAEIIPWELVHGVALAGLLGSILEAFAAPLLKRAPHSGLMGNMVVTSSGAALAAASAYVLLGGGGA